MDKFLFLFLFGISSLGQATTATMEMVERDGVAITVGNAHACAIGKKGVQCWGNHSMGATDVPPLYNPTQVTAGFSHTCALDGSRVVCWGDDEDENEVPTKFKNIRQIAAGYHISCALDDLGVTCWRASNYAYKVSSLPVKNPIQIFAGMFFVVVVEESGNVWLGAPRLSPPNGRYRPSFFSPRLISFSPTGEFGHGYVFNGKNEVRAFNVVENDPFLAALSKHPIPDALAAGLNHGCAIYGGELKCWGGNDFGQTQIPPLKKPTQIVAGGGFNCAVDKEGVKCWGRNDYGQTNVPKNLLSKIGFPK